MMRRNVRGAAHSRGPVGMLRRPGVLRANHEQGVVGERPALSGLSLEVAEQAQLHFTTLRTHRHAALLLLHIGIATQTHSSAPPWQIPSWLPEHAAPRKQGVSSPVLE